MKQKIEWYREVLELEPGSRVFFPLAKLLAADGQTSEAVFTLQQGLLRHPDHMEARFLLVELLHLQNAGQELALEIDCLAGLFASYPGFWTAWNEKLAATPALRDAALAMRFFAAALQGKQVSWGAIIEQGLQSMLSDGGKQGATSSAFVLSRHTAQEALAMQHSAAAAANAGGASPASPPRTLPKISVTLTKEPTFPVPVDGSAGTEEEEGEEVFSLRTRSMAEVLAGQGDIAGALEIYNELLREAPENEKSALEARIDELSKGCVVSDDHKSEDKLQSPGGESTRLVSLLESLAQRLEARVR